MTEIPMPTEGFEEAPRPEKKSGCCGRNIMCVVAIIAIAVVAIVAISMLGGPGGEPEYTYDTRSINYYSNQDVDLYPIYYRSEFSVSSSETYGEFNPDIWYVIDVDDTGSDSVSVTIHFAIYEIDQYSFDNLEESEWDSYLIDSQEYTNSADDFINLNDYSSTYVWVLWFDASYKYDVWDVDIDLTLRYNWERI